MVEPAGTAASTSERVATVCVAGAALCALIPLAGWAVGEPEVARFSASGAPLWPLSAIGYLALATSFVAAMRGRRATAIALLAIPVLVAITGTYERTTNLSLGVDDLLFRETVRSVPAMAPGRPGAMALIAFAFLSIALALATRPSRRTGRIVALLASLILAFGAFTCAIIVARVGSAGQPGVPGTPLPSALAAMLLGVALLAWRVESGWTGLMEMRSRDTRMLTLMFPLILLLPIVSALLGLGVTELGMDRLSSALIAACANVLIVASLLIGTTQRMLRGRSALEEVTAALDTAPIMIVDQADTITHWSLGCEQLYGWTAEEAIGRTRHSLLRTHAPDEGSGGAGPGERIDHHRDGNPIHVIERRDRVSLYGGETADVIGITDISERIAMEAELRQSTERLSAAMEAHPVGIFEWDVKAGRLEWVDGSEASLGVERGTFDEFEVWRSMVEPDDLAAVEQSIAAATARRAPRFSFSYRIRHPNGRVRAIDGAAQAYYNAAGEMIRAVGVNVDVTEREDHEAELQAREAQLRSIVETVPDAMIVIDEAGTIQSFSRAAEQLLGYGADEVIGDSIDLILPPEHRGRHDSYIRRYLATGERRVIGHARLLTAMTATGDAIPIELRVGEAMAGGRRLFTGFLRDQRSRLEGEERLNRLQHELAHVGRLGAMGEMAAGLAHELNQPLAATVNFLATADMLLGRNGEPERIREMLDMASGQALRAGQIIRRLRNFVSRQEPEVRAEPVAAIVEEAVALVLVGQGKLNVGVEYRLDPEAKTMFADRVQIQQVLVNLIRNAVEAMRDAGVSPMALTIESRAVDEETMEIGVCDGGPGIPDAVLDNLFTPFLSTKEDGGMGVGLSICRRIVEAHGGSISAANRIEGGACFRFTVPMINEREVRQA